MKRTGTVAAMLLACATPVQADFSTVEQQLNQAFEAGQLTGLHSVLVARDGQVLSEAYFTGADQRWGAAIGEVAHSPDSLHDLRSVTKSVVGLLYGIALTQGRVPALDTPLLEALSEYADLLDTPDKRAITVRHVLAMKMGTQWDESLPYTSRENSEVAMEYAPERYRYVLEQPQVNTPGDWWNYSGGATALLERLIAKGTGMPLDAFAQQALFAPLEIEQYEWVAGADGKPSAASGLRLTTRGLAKIGQLIAQQGEYNGARLVSADWITQMLTPHAQLEGLRYGLHWWLAPEGQPPVWVAGFGNGGQRLTIGLQSRTVIVTFAGRYNDPDAWRLPLNVILDYVNPALKAEKAREQTKDQ